MSFLCTKDSFTFFAMEIFIMDGFHARRKDNHSWKTIIYFAKRNMVSLNKWALKCFGINIVPLLFRANHVGWGMWVHLPHEICKFPKENIGLQFSFSKNLLQPSFLLSWGNLAKEVGPNCTKIWELSLRKCPKVPQLKHKLNYCSFEELFSFEQFGFRVEPSWMTPFFIWYLWSFHLKKSSI
jgi:hypothetical protein